MIAQCSQQAQRVENRWLAPLLPSILAAASFILPVASASLSAAMECQVTEDGGTIQGMTAWKGTTSIILPLTITVERDTFGGLVTSLMLEVAPDMNSSRFAWGNRVNQEIAAIGACLSQDIRKNARFTQAMMASIGSTQAKAHTKVMKVSALPYNGKRQVHTIRTTPPEIGISPRDKASTLIGPVQENWQPGQANAQGLNQSIAMRPIGSEALTLFDGRPILAIEQLQTGLRPPVNESMRMNMTTTQALHGGNYAFP